MTDGDGLPFTGQQNARQGSNPQAGVPSWALKYHDGTAQLAHIIPPGRGDQDSALMVSRCDANGVKNATGGHWKIFEA
ncbi:hypothetical protein [Methylobacterium tarhaniae]|uniref:hypothetical protein n=1 Tax=Methylobacterium tarhaniae TaxID=1187852 RepID=UPI0012ECEE85|nr:hypothetical protein [Methylobacterium tarhaniae]